MSINPIRFVAEAQKTFWIHASPGYKLVALVASVVGGILADRLISSVIQNIPIGEWRRRVLIIIISSCALFTTLWGAVNRAKTQSLGLDQVLKGKHPFFIFVRAQKTFWANSSLVNKLSAIATSFLFGMGAAVAISSAVEKFQRQDEEPTEGLVFSSILFCSVIYTTAEGIFAQMRAGS